MNNENENSASQVDAIVSTLWKKCEEERLTKTYACRDEAERWKAEGDWYGWNFHQGRASGTIEASFIYNRMRRAMPAIDAMAELLRKFRNDNNAEQVDAVLRAAGYEG